MGGAGPTITVHWLWPQCPGPHPKRQRWPREKVGLSHSAQETREEGRTCRERVRLRLSPRRVPAALQGPRTHTRMRTHCRPPPPLRATHPDTAPVCPAAHAHCRSPGGFEAALSCPLLSRRAAMCSGTASLGRGHGRGKGHGSWTLFLGAPTTPRIAWIQAASCHPLVASSWALGCPWGCYGPEAAEEPLSRSARTCVVIAPVPEAQGPQALRVLVPEVGGHEGPVTVALTTVVQRSGGRGQQRGEKGDLRCQRAGRTVRRRAAGSPPAPHTLWPPVWSGCPWGW